jgi:NADH dehydrogenase [ubiquinone] 1 alpha subcomplex assembly factor 7
VGGGGLLPLVRCTAAATGQSDIVNALKRKLLDLIEAQGPLTVAQYMAIALGDPDYGYYMRRDPLGRDFITAPEVSQIFGELIGLFFVQVWEDRRRPGKFQFVELGPGRGTLMADMMRAAGKLRPQFIGGARVTLVETSPTLREAQKKTLGSFAVNWASRFDDIPAEGPLFLIANEFFDALPFHQFVKSERGWHERMVTNDGENLRFALTPDIVPLSVIPARVRDAAPGSVIEVNLGATELVRRIASRIAENGGVALIIDYGHVTTAVGDTLQAMKDNAFADPLAEPGEADITAHVDFEALATAASEGEALTPIIPVQGEFLEALGIHARANRLKRDNPERIAEIDSAVDRLTNPKQMGTMFKALAIFEGTDQALPPGFDG